MHKAPVPLKLERVREIPQSFSWIDRRLIQNNILAYLSKDEKVLYFFLLTVANKQGVSYYGPRKLRLHTGLTKNELITACTGLEEMDLIAYRSPFYQVLSLPDEPAWRRISAKRFRSRLEQRKVMP